MTEFDTPSGELEQRHSVPQLGEVALLGDQLPYQASTVSVIEAITAGCPEIEPREEQLECLDALQRVRDIGEKRALVQMATGLGKTTVVAADVKRFLEEKPEARVLFLCHQNRILDQAQERFRRVLGSDYTYGTFTGEEEKELHEVSCLFASFQAFTRGGWYEAFLENEFDYIVVDESHHAKAPTYEPILQYFKPNFLLGITGTPDRHDMKDIREIFGPEVYRLSLEEALARELLATPEYHVLIDEIEAERVLKDVDGRKLNIKQLNRSIFVPIRDEEIVRLSNEKAADLGGPVRRIVFCPTIEYSEEITQYFENSAPLHSGQNPTERLAHLEDFRSGRIDTLVVRDILNEGIDIPEVNQVVFLRMTDSKTIFFQQLGRGLRKFPGKNHVQVLDFVANCDRLTMVDAFWKRVRQYQETELEDKDIERINAGGIEFTESTRQVLSILSDMESRSAYYRSLKRDDLLQLFIAECNKAGHTLTYRDVTAMSKKNETPPPHIFTRLFGTWNDFVRAAGLEPNLTRELPEREDLIKALRDFVDTQRFVPTSRQAHQANKTGLLPSEHFYTRTFGTWNEALEAAGLTPNLRQGHTRQEILEALKIYLGQKGYAPTTREYDLDKKNGDAPISRMVIQRLFGSWDNAMQELASLPLDERPALLTVRRRSSPQKPKWTAEEITASLRWFYEEYGYVPSGDDIDEHSKANLMPSRTVYAKYFGSVDKAILAAGMSLAEKKGQARRFTREELLEQLRHIAEEVGIESAYNYIRDPSNRGRVASPSTFEKVFGSYRSAVEELGLG